MFMSVKQNSSSQTGFTLIELAVVLIVVGILLGSFIGTLTGRIDVTRKSDAIGELEEIKQAMMAYAFVNGYLPCPDCDAVGGNCVAGVVGDGIADYNAGACLENEGAGNVPWVTLGLGKSDPWGTHYRYAVQNLYADVNNAFELDAAAGSAVVREPDFAADATGATPQMLANNVVAVIFSHGKNSFGGNSEPNIARDPVPAAAA